ncbi:urease accessory protein UreD [Marinobacter sp. 1Y8]
MTIYTPIAQPLSPDALSNTAPANGSGHRFDAGRRWAASIELGFESRSEQSHTVTRLTRRRHQGPLRVQRPFYPEGKTGCCHVYLLHPPGGLVSGDALHIEANIGAGAHTLLTTPAAAKLYKADSHGVAWAQHTHLKVAKGATLEWLPQETLAFDGSRGEQTTTIDLEDDARCIGWEILALGRPASDLPFVSGHLEQRFRLNRDGRPLWQERQPMDPKHPRFKGKWGQGGATVQATLWAVGLEDEAGAVEALREAIPTSVRWAVTRRREVLLLRYLGNERNEAWALCQQAWEILRPRLTGQQAHIPRIWLT